jgi:pimeloyl-ACP methyl ester carboxylesterase
METSQLYSKLVRVIVLAAAFLFTTTSTSLSLNARYIRRTEAASTIIIFIHGFLSDAASSWTNGDSYWPQMVSEDAIFKGADVYVYEYPSRGAKIDFSIDEISEDMRIRLSADGVSSHEHIVFVAHSMGALVTRSFLLKYREIAERTLLLYFLSSPTTGSELANVFSLVNRSPQLLKLQVLQSEDYLADLQRNWLAANFPFPTYCAYEKRPTMGALVVTQASASNLCTRALDPIDADHITIAKPASQTSAQYQALANAFTQSNSALQKANQARLSFQYARLFGAIEIPLLMKFIPAPGFQKSEMRGYSSPKGKKYKDFDDVRPELARFAQDLPFKDARPLLTKLWTDVAGNEDAAINIFWRASSAGRNERACFYMEPLIDEIVLNEGLVGSFLPRDWEKSCPKIQKEFDNRIGFTFLIIENDSAEKIDDISLFYRETYSDNQVTKEFSDKWLAPQRPRLEREKKIRSTITEISNASAFENLTARYSTAQALEAAVRMRPLKELKMSEMKSGEKRIVALNVYFADERNLPAGYLYGIYHFEKAEYSTSSGRHALPIRQPYLEKAARVAVPYGWFNQ